MAPADPTPADPDEPLGPRHPQEEQVIARSRLRPWVPALLAVALGGGVVVWSAAALPGLPDRVPVHWGADGRPDAWEPTSLFALTQGVVITLPMLVGTVVLVAFILKATLTAAPTASHWTRLRRVADRRGMTAGLGWTALLVTVLASLPTAQLLLAGSETLPWWVHPLMLTVVMAGVFAALNWSIRRWRAWADAAAAELGYRPSPQEAAEEHLWTPLGMKVDPHDSRVTVPKREGHGEGTTVNIGSRTGRLLYRGFVAAFFLVLPAVVWIVAFTAR